MKVVGANDDDDDEDAMIEDVNYLDLSSGESEAQLEEL